MHLKIFLLSVLITLMTKVVAQQTAFVDIRETTGKGKNYVGIVVRDNTLTGHAFVVLGKENDEKKISEMSVHGFYPKHEGSPLDDGHVINDFYSLKYVKDVQQQIYFIVNDDEYNAAVQTVSVWTTKPPIFNIISNNCIDLTKKVAESVGLNFPSRLLHPGSITPVKYMLLIKKELGSKEGISYKSNLRVKTFVNNQAYIGKLRDGKFDGLGRLSSKNGIESGTFKNGLRQGEFRTIKEDGTIWVTSYDRNISSDQLTRYYKNGDKFEDFIKDGKEVSKMTWANGDTYTTEKNGDEFKTTYTTPGFKVSGTDYDIFHPNKPPDSYGFQRVLIEATNYIFNGDWWYSDNETYQKGKVLFNNGDSYEGYLKNMVFHGNGRLIHNGKKDCMVLGLFCTSNSYDITDDFVDGFCPSLQRIGIMPSPAEAITQSLMPPMRDDRLDATTTPSTNKPMDGLDNLDPVPDIRTNKKPEVVRPPRPDGYTDRNSFWDPIRIKWIKL